MELFSEIYNCYYKIVDQILKQASLSPLTRQEMEKIAENTGYAESGLNIIPKLINGDWNLLEAKDKSYSSKIKNPGEVPLSALQKSWLKSLLSDRKIKLFFTEEQLQTLSQYLKDEEPLFSCDDFLYYDRYADGDPYEDPLYQQHFQVILNAIKEHRVLKFGYLSGKQKLIDHSCLPCKLEYSSKNDKFRILCLYATSKGGWQLEIINISRILKLTPSTFWVPQPPDINIYLKKFISQAPVLLCITDERNALERTMLHFAAYEKRTEQIEGTNQYLCSIYFDKAAETELLIQILSFGPTVRVLGPEKFLDQVKERVQKQIKIAGDF